VFRNDGPLSDRPAQKLRKYTPAGFSWGSSGSGARLLAVALLLDVVGKDEAWSHYVAFTFQVVSTWPWDGPWEMSEADVLRWVGMQHRRENGRKEVMASSVR